MDVPYCRDCEHIIFDYALGFVFAKCRLTRWVDVVSGEEQFRYCADERGYANIGSSSHCGPDGGLFKAKS